MATTSWPASLGRVHASITLLTLALAAPAYPAQPAPPMAGKPAPTAVKNLVAQSEIPVGAQLPDVALAALSGAGAKLSDYRGRPLVINVWASWCAPCRQEMASLERLSRVKGAEQFSVIGISTDDYPEAARGFLKRAGTGFPHYIDQKLQLEKLLGADRLPLTVLVDAKGKILSRHYGAEEWDSPRALTLIGLAFHIKL